MSNSRDLLKEAIADAKSVKEAAIANAKAALEEAFTPYLQEKFAAKLQEMELEEEEDETIEMTDENYGMRVGDEPSMEEAYDDKMEEANTMDELNLEELLAELEEEERTKGMKEETEESLTEAEEEETEEEESEEGEGEEKEIDLEDMSEEDLKSLIEDVIADMVKTGELEAGENFEAEESDEDDKEIDFEEEDEESEEEEVNEILNEEKINENMTQTLEFVRDNAPEVMDVLLQIQKSVGVDPGQALTLAAAIAGVGIPSMIGLDLKRGEEGKSKILNIAKKVGDGAKKLLGILKGAGTTNEVEVEEMESRIEELASTLSEVKLLNAKLLYTNKIFRAKNLNETQKVKVLEAFDKATSVRDAKLIYETLTTIKETKSPVTESMRGMASKAAGMAPEKKPILEVNDQFARWQVLAGIKRN